MSIALEIGGAAIDLETATPHVHHQYSLASGNADSECYLQKHAISASRAKDHSRS